MSLAAGAMVEQLDLDLFMRQGMDYKDEGGGLERLTRLMLDLGVTHPMPVRRTHELMAWVRSGEFDRIVDGEYPRRGDPVSARADSSEAVSFYVERSATASATRASRSARSGRSLPGGCAGRRGGEPGEDGELGEDGRSLRRASAPRRASAARRGDVLVLDGRPGASGHRDRQAHDRAALGRAAPFQLAADELRALAHSDIPKPPSSPSPRGPSRAVSGRPRPSSVTDASTSPSRESTLITALVACAWRLTFVAPPGRPGRSCSRARRPGAGLPFWAAWVSLSAMPLRSICVLTSSPSIACARRASASSAAASPRSSSAAGRSSVSDGAGRRSPCRGPRAPRPPPR